MPYQLEPFVETGLNELLLNALIARHESTIAPALRTLWTYYRNPITSLASVAGSTSGQSTRGFSANQRQYRLGQEHGLPPRLSGRTGSDVNADDRSASRKEIVIENDIGWRLHTMVDFMFGRRVTLMSTAADKKLRRQIEKALDAVWETSGGIGLLQDMGLLGHVYGHVDLLVRKRSEIAGERGGQQRTEVEQDAADAVAIEIVEPTRGIPLQSSGDFRRLSAYVVRYRREDAAVEPGMRLGGTLSRILGWRSGPEASGSIGGSRRIVIVTEIFSGSTRQVYEEHAERSGSDRAATGPRLVEQDDDSVAPGEIPIVHIQNVSQPFSYTGLSEVEPLIPLQDELNIRLCDRANRVTMQSFQMFLAKGIDGFDKSPVAPGQIWATDNIEARVESFGGDAHAPGEDEHIEQIREALDKASGVPPLASGVVRAKIGNLTSENALRVTLMGLLSKTARKRVTYGRGIAETSRLVLAALDRAGILKTDPSERGIRVEWPDPLPRDEKDLLEAARAKLELGVPRERVLSELGYSPIDPGIV